MVDFNLPLGWALKYGSPASYNVPVFDYSNYYVVARDNPRGYELNTKADGTGNVIGTPAWSEFFGGISNTEYSFGDIVDQYIVDHYAGKRVSEIPTWRTISVPSIPHIQTPFAEIFPGIPNFGVNPVTGDTPVNTVIDAAGALLNIGQVLSNFLGFIFTPTGLALVGGVVIIYLGYKGIMNSSTDNA